jgi:hypothetical protein
MFALFLWDSVGIFGFLSSLVFCARSLNRIRRLLFE